MSLNYKTGYLTNTAYCPVFRQQLSVFNPLNAELNPNCHLLELLGAHPILHVGRIRVKDAKC
jgi:hypothetical protein